MPFFFSYRQPFYVFKWLRWERCDFRRCTTLNKGRPWKKLIDTKAMIVNHKETKMVIDGEDWRGLRTTNLKNLGWTFQRWASLDVATWILFQALLNDWHKALLNDWHAQGPASQALGWLGNSERKNFLPLAGALSACPRPKAREANQMARLTIDISIDLARKYAWIFEPGHYYFRQTNCSLFKQVRRHFRAKLRFPSFGYITWLHHVTCSDQNARKKDI